MKPPRCRLCDREMRVRGLIPVNDCSPARVFQVWCCPSGACEGQAVTEAGTVKPDEWERRRDQ